MPTRRSLLRLSIAAPLLLAPRLAAAGPPRVFAEDELALRGYDPVAYFRLNRPQRGSDAHLLRWKGAIWCFASAENRQIFEAAPRRFAPAYGGYCAYAMAHGWRAPTVPEAFTIAGGRLYLNSGLAVRSLWRRDIPRHVRAADANWRAQFN